MDNFNTDNTQEDIYEKPPAPLNETFLDNNGTAPPAFPQNNPTNRNHLPNTNINNFAQTPNRVPTHVTPPPTGKAKKNKGVAVFLIILASLAQLSFVSLIAFSAIQLLSQDSLSYDPDIFEDFIEEDEAIDPEPYQPDWEEVPDAEDETLPPQPDIFVPENVDGMILQSEPNGETLSPEAVYEKVIVSTVTVHTQINVGGVISENFGTGIIVTSDGFIITNSHVIGDTRDAIVNIILSDGTEYPALVVGLDRATDLAVLKTDDYGFIPAEFGSSDELSMGEWVMAIGNPGGEEFRGSITRGIVSGLDRMVGLESDDAMTYIQTDTAINPGNSGGPLVNMHGQVIGINVFKIVGSDYEGMGFAIPTSKAKDVVDQLLQGGYVEGRVRLGVTVSNVTETENLLQGIPLGIRLEGIDPDSSLIGTDAEVGDIITHVDGEQIVDLSTLSDILLRYSPGDVVEFTIYKSDTETEVIVSCTLLEDKGETQ